MENSRTPRKAPDALIKALERALAPRIKDWHQRQPACEGSAVVSPPIAVAIALSGGLDSSVLLHASARLLKPLGIELLAIHINHGLSPHAEQWAEFCGQQCRALDVELISVTVNVPKQASLEAAAREVRYQALKEHAQRRGAAILLTAHHANDQAETLLLNLLRGSGLAGLRGIAGERRMGELWLLRPWLDVARQALLDYASKQQLPWIEDESNQDVRFRRNALRHQVMPALLAFTPDAIERLVSVTRHASTSAELLDALGAIDLAACGAGGGLALARMATLARARSANLLRYWLRHNGYGVPSESAIDEWLTQLLSGAASLELDLAGRQFVIEGGVIMPLQAPLAAACPPPLMLLRWNGEAALEVPTWRGVMQFELADGTGIPLQRMQRDALSLRQRSGGERMQLAPHAPSRTLKNLYQEAGISMRARQSLPLLYGGDDLLFAAGLGMNLRQCETGQQRVVLHWLANA